MFLGRCCAKHALKKSYIELARDKYVLYERMFYFVLLNYDEASTREIVNVIHFRLLSS